MQRKSFIDAEKVEALNSKIYEKGSLDRAHLMEFLTYIDTSDGKTIVDEVKKWLEKLHSDPEYSKIVFPQGNIDAILGDLDSYGRVQPETIMAYKEGSVRTVQIS